MDSATFKTRIKTVVPILKPYYKDKTETVITEALESIGIDDSEIGYQILESSTTTANDFVLALPFLNKGKEQTVPPEPRVRAAWLVLQGKDPFALKVSNTNISNYTINKDDAVQLMLKKLEEQKPIGQWSDQDLLKNYGKHCPLNVEDELLKRSKSKPVIIFNDDGTIDIDASLVLLRQARHNDTPSTYIVDSKMKQVYKISDFPMDVMYECPIHSNVLLFNGYCEECGIKWPGLDTSNTLDIEDKEKYIFLRLLSGNVKIEPVALRTYIKSSLDELMNLYPKIALKYNRLKEEENLPTLKRRMSKSKEGDPFRIVHTTY